MRATVMYGAGDVRIENVPDAAIVEPTDAIVRVTRACICGSDLWPYKSMEPTESGQSMGHESIGVVEDVGAEVSHGQAGRPGGDARSLARTAPASSATRACTPPACMAASSATTACDGAQAEALRVPYADGTLVQAAGRRGRRADALAADALRRDGHRPPRRGRRAVEPRQPRRGDRRRRRRAVRRDRRQAPRRRADHHHGPPRGPHRLAASSAPPTSSPSAARRPSSGCAS